jgi:hypothetical protein
MVAGVQVRGLDLGACCEVDTERGFSKLEGVMVWPNTKAVLPHPKDCYSSRGQYKIFRSLSVNVLDGMLHAPVLEHPSARCGMNEEGPLNLAEMPLGLCVTGRTK